MKIKIKLVNCVSEIEFTEHTIEVTEDYIILFNKDDIVSFKVENDLVYSLEVIRA